jgi:hypothetical protein
MTAAPSSVWIAALRLALLLGLSAASACAWTASAGRVDNVGGNVTVVRPSGTTPLRTGSEVQEGDTLVTGPDGWALLSMVDGGIITLRPDTRLRIDTYRYSAGARNDDSVLLNLLRGAFRSVTGEVGHFFRANYQIKTPTATIGIRGTDHEPAYFAPGESGDHEPGTFDRVAEGESYIENPRGRVPVRAGQFGFVHHDGRSAPRLLDRLPAFYGRNAELDKRLDARHRALKELRQQRIERRLERRPHDGGSPSARPGAHQWTERRERGPEAHAGRDLPNGAPRWREERVEQRRMKAQEWQHRPRDQQAAHSSQRFHRNRE